MAPSASCTHAPLDGSATCSRCGAPVISSPGMRVRVGVPVRTGLLAGSMGGTGGIEEYQRQMAERAAKQKRNKIIMAVVVLGGLGVGGFFWMGERKKAAQAQVILEAGGRFAEKDKGEVGAFWNCVTSSEVDVGNFKGVDEIQMRVESAYFTQQKTFSEHLTTECVPKIERARAAMGGLASDFPPDMKAALDKYLATLPKMQAGIESYAEKVKGRSAVKDVDGSIQEIGGLFSPDPTAASTAFEKFLVCAIPDLDKKKDMQEVLEWLFNTCKNDAVKFMTRVRETCGPALQAVNKDDPKGVPSKTFKVNAKKFLDEDQRQLQAWEFCGKKSRKGKKVLDLEEFLNASGDYMEARGEVAQATRETAARITGTPLEAPRAKAGEAGTAPAAPKAAAPGAKAE
jgi:hypothetical protein